MERFQKGWCRYLRQFTKIGTAPNGADENARIIYMRTHPNTITIMAPLVNRLEEAIARTPTFIAGAPDDLVGQCASAGAWRSGYSDELSVVGQGGPKWLVK